MYAKKSLGQNFLNSPQAIAKIVETGKIVPGEIVLEVGPGKGVLTEALLLKGAKVFAVEKDDNLIPLLEGKFQKEIEEGRFTLVHKDVLEFDPKEHGLETRKYKLIANIPYYITGIFLRNFLSGKSQPSDMVLMVQKEVAERIVARGKTTKSFKKGKDKTPETISKGKESILSMSVKVYGEPKYIQTVKAGSFVPAPNVDSAILSIENISKDFFGNFNEELFFELLKTGFAGKRKMLSNNLRNFYDTHTELFKNRTLVEVLSEASIPEKVRAEDLALLDWKKILETLSK